MFSRLLNVAKTKLPLFTNQIRRVQTVNWYEYHYIKPEDISTVQTTWAKINQDPKITCRHIFKTLFKKSPELEKLYERYKDSPTTSVVDSTKFEPRCTSFAGNMTVLIENLNDQDVTLKILKRLADSHKGTVKPEFFIALIDVMIETVRDLGGEEFTPDAEKKWRRIMFATMTTVTDFLQ